MNNFMLLPAVMLRGIISQSAGRLLEWSVGFVHENIEIGVLNAGQRVKRKAS